MVDYTIKYDRNKCIGAGTCVEFAPETWELDNEGKAKQKKTKITEAELDNNVKAAKSCPAQAIEIYDEKGKKIV